MANNGHVNTSIRWPKQTQERIRVIAKSKGRSISSHLRILAESDIEAADKAASSPASKRTR